MNQISPNKTYKCRICKAPFVKSRPMQSICGDTKCIVETVYRSQAKRERTERATTKQKLAAIATKPELTKLAQKAFNDYIRARDYGKPCICCGNPIPWGTTKTTGGVCDAGHYLSIGARVNLRFDESNVHAQLKSCNNYKAGNAVNYRINLIKRIGLERVDALESDHELKHWTKDQLRDIATKYKQMIKELKREHL